MLQNCYLRSCFFVFFTHGKKNVISHQNFGGWTWNVEMHTRNFLFKLFDFLNIFKMYFYNRCICSYEPKHYVLNILHDTRISCYPL
jgi:hypothetical protein